MHVSEFETAFARRSLSLGLPVSPQAAAAIAAEADITADVLSEMETAHEEDQAEADAQAKADEERIEDLESELEAARNTIETLQDRLSDLESELEAARNTIETLQDRLSELMDDDTRGMVRAKLIALRDEIMTGFMVTAQREVSAGRRQNARDLAMRNLGRAIVAAFAAADPPADRKSA